MFKNPLFFCIRKKIGGFIMKNFVHLHTHSVFSLLDGLTKVEDMVDKTLKLELPASCITDHGNMYSFVNHFKYAEENGQKPIAGFEAYVVNDLTVKNKDEKREHLVLLAKNNDGYKQMSKICSIGATQGMYYRPRIDDKIMQEVGTENLIASSACFLMNTDVITKRGIKPIQNVTEEDYVLTHLGRYKKVNKSFSMLYSDDIYNIRSNSFPINCTKDHKFLVVKDNNVEWKEAQELTENDYLLQVVEDTVDKFEELDVSFLKKQGKLKSYTIKLTNEFLEFLAIYCVMGIDSSAAVSFIVDCENILLINKITTELENLVNIPFTIVNNLEKKQVAITICSEEVSSLLRYLMGSNVISNSNSKMLPDIIKWLSFDKQLFFLKGFIINNSSFEDGKVSVVLYSKQLYYDISHMLARCNVSHTVESQNRYIDDLEFLHNATFTVTIEDEDFINFLYNGESFRLKHFFEVDGVKYIKNKIQSITANWAELNVYCLEVDEDSSFVANNVVTHNCLAGRIPRCLLKDDIEKAEYWCKHYAQMFKNSFYLEIQPTEIPSQVKVNKGLIELSKKLGIPLIASTDAHYLNKEDKETHDVLLCLQTKDLLSNPNRWTFEGNSYYIMSYEEIIDAFKKNGHEELDQDAVLEAIHNTVDVAKQCNVHIDFGKHYLPKIEPPKDDDNYNKQVEKKLKRDKNFKSDDASYLRYLCLQGLKRKLPDLDTNLEKRKIYLDRLNHELEVIETMGFPSYFLIVADYINYADKVAKMGVGPGRGCFTPDNLVNTENRGLVKIADVIVNDLIKGHDEKTHKVINTLNYDCDEEVLQIFSEDGKSLTLTKDHKLFAIKKEDFDKGIRTPQWYGADELNENDYIAELE
jgi:intein/homing endonuclease